MNTTKDRICTRCRTVQAVSVCCCKDIVRLCQTCISAHYAQNQFEVHTLFPATADEFLSIPGYLDRLKKRREGKDQGISELTENLKRVSFCELVFMQKIDTAIEAMQEYRDQTLSMLKKYRTTLAETVEKAVLEANEHIFEENYATKSRLTAELLTYRPGRLTLFKFDLSPEGKLTPEFRLHPEDLGGASLPAPQISHESAQFSNPFLVANLTSTQSSPQSPVLTSPRLPLVLTSEVPQTLEKPNPSLFLVPSPVVGNNRPVTYPIQQKIDLPAPKNPFFSPGEPGIGTAGNGGMNPFLKTPETKVRQLSPGVSLDLQKLRSLQPPQSPIPAAISKPTTQVESGSETCSTEERKPTNLSGVNNLLIFTKIPIPIPVKLAKSAISLLKLKEKPEKLNFVSSREMLISRYTAIAVLADESMLLCGGDNPVTPNAYTFNPGTGAMDVLNPMHVARFAHGVACYGTCVYVFGGRNSTETLTASERYLRKGGNWQELSPLHYAHAYFNPCVYSRIIYIFGGIDCSKAEYFEIERLRSVDVPFSLPMSGEAASVIVNDELIVIQGQVVSRIRLNLKGGLQVVDVNLEERLGTSWSPWSNLYPVVVDSTVLLAQCYREQVVKIDVKDWKSQILT